MTARTQMGADADSFASAILDAEVNPAVSETHLEIPLPPLDTPHLNSEWQRLCRDKGWVCRICNAQPSDVESPLGYEDGLCPAHRLVSHSE